MRSCCCFFFLILCYFVYNCRVKKCVSKLNLKQIFHQEVFTCFWTNTEGKHNHLVAWKNPLSQNIESHFQLTTYFPQYQSFRNYAKTFADLKMSAVVWWIFVSVWPVNIIIPLNLFQSNYNCCEKLPFKVFSFKCVMLRHSKRSKHS